MAQGKVKWLNEDKGYGFSYGFISPSDGGEDLFVEVFFVRHSAAATGVGILYEGELVAYEVAMDRWGSTAENVCALKSSGPLIPPRSRVDTPARW